MNIEYVIKNWHAGMTNNMHLRNKSLTYANEFEDILDKIKLDLSIKYEDHHVVVILINNMANQVYWISVNEIIEWLDLPFINKRMFLLM